jgi:hypothetical protein
MVNENAKAWLFVFLIFSLVCATPLMFGLANLGGCFIVLARLLCYILGFLLIVFFERKSPYLKSRRNILGVASSIPLLMLIAVTLLAFLKHRGGGPILLALIVLSGFLSLTCIWNLILIYKNREGLFQKIYGWSSSLVVGAAAVVLMIIPPLPMII